MRGSMLLWVLVAVSCASPLTGRFDGVPAEDVELTLSFGAKLNMTGGAYGWKGPTPCTGSAYAYDTASGAVALPELSNRSSCARAFMDWFYAADGVESSGVTLAFSAYQGMLVLSHPRAPPIVLERSRQ